MYFPPADYKSFIQNFLIICKKGKKKETQKTILRKKGLAKIKIATYGKN